MTVSTLLFRLLGSRFPKAKEAATVHPRIGNRENSSLPALALVQFEDSWKPLVFLFGSSQMDSWEGSSWSLAGFPAIQGRIVWPDCVLTDLDFGFSLALFLGFLPPFFLFLSWLMNTSWTGSLWSTALWLHILASSQGKWWLHIWILLELEPCQQTGRLCPNLGSYQGRNPTS
jgi:hypothetical protein